jgi:GntR family transcriptional regulator, regulator for abcA and norABC
MHYNQYKISNQFKIFIQPIIDEVNVMSSPSPQKKTITIDWKPEKQSKISLVDQIVSYFKTCISKGDWLCDDPLPPQRELAKMFEVNRSTIVSALSELASLGIIESTVGKGTVIANNSWSFLFAESPPNWNDYIEHGFHKSNLPTIQAINKYEFINPIIRLSTGEVAPELMPHDVISNALIDLAASKKPFNYLEPLGLYELRVELCRYLRKFEINIKPSEILIVSGSLQALQLISLSLLGNKSTVFVEENSYVKSLKVFEFSDVQMKAVPMDKDGPIPWMIDDSMLKKGNSMLYTIPTFHNPTGLTMGASRRHELLNWCKKNHLPIIEDDAYRELYFDEKPPNPIKSMDSSGNILYLGSTSKALAPGLRIGWVIGPESIIERLGDIKMQTDYGASSISQWLLTYLFKNNLYENHMSSLRNNLKSRCQMMLQLLDTYFSDIATWNIPTGGFYIWLKLKPPIATDKLFDLALKNNILINPGYIYSFKKNNHIRLSYSYASYTEMETGLKLLSQMIRNMNTAIG